MTSDQELEILKTQPPRVPLTLGDKVERVIGWLTAVISVTALSIAILVGFNGAAIAQCVNNNLGPRNATSAKDASAHIKFAEALDNVLLAPKADQARLYGVFLVQLNAYVTTLTADQKARAAKPLGKC